MPDVEPPGLQASESGPCGWSHGSRVVVAEQRNSDRAGVEPCRVSADHIPVDATEAAFEDLAVLVDEKVVADVVPAVRAHGYSWMPRTMAADCVRVYVFDPAVW